MVLFIYTTIAWQCHNTLCYNISVTFQLYNFCYIVYTEYVAKSI